MREQGGGLSRVWEAQTVAMDGIMFVDVDVGTGMGVGIAEYALS